MGESNDLALGYVMGQDGNSSNNGGGFGGWGEGIWAVIILAILFGWGRGGMGGFGGGESGGGSMQPIVIDSGRSGGGGCGCQSCATVNDLASGFNNAAVLSNLNDLALGQAGIQQTLCQGFNGVNMTVMQGFNGVDNAICNLGYNVQSGFNGVTRQIADCCCDIKGGIKDIAYGNAMNTSAIQRQISDCCCDIEKANMQNRFDAQAYNCNTLQAIDKLGDRIIDFMSAEKLQTLRDENQALRLAASQSNQNAVLRAAIDASTAEIIRRTGNECPIPAFVVPNPNCCYGNPVGVGYSGYGRDGGCGCC